MISRLRPLPLLILAVALIVAGCDQSSQNPDFTTGDTYIITQANSAIGDAGRDSVTVPDTVSYFVQGFTINKDYTWTVDGTEPPTETRADQTHVWERRDGEFISVIYGPGDPITSISDELSSHSVSVDASSDDIGQETLELVAGIPRLAGQVGRLPAFASLSGLTASSGIASMLGGEGPFTLLAPQNSVFDDLDPAPTQATDPDEPATSSVQGDILKYHVLPASLSPDDISNGQTAQTLLGDQTVTFNVSGGQITINGGPQVVRSNLPVSNGVLLQIDGLLTPSTALLDFTNRTVDSLAAGDSVSVDGSFFPDGGGFVVLHDSAAVADQGGPSPSTVLGSSDFVSSGIQNGIGVPLDVAISNTTTVEAVAHEDTDGDEMYDFESSGGMTDTPYTLEGDPVSDVGIINIASDDG